jgi:hypothetical protein
MIYSKLNTLQKNENYRKDFSVEAIVPGCDEVKYYLTKQHQKYSISKFVANYRISFFITTD